MIPALSTADLSTEALSAAPLGLRAAEDDAALSTDVGSPWVNLAIFAGFVVVTLFFVIRPRRPPRPPPTSTPADADSPAPRTAPPSPATSSPRPPSWA